MSLTPGTVLSASYSSGKTNTRCSINVEQREWQLVRNIAGCATLGL